jgi:hypothetical protein
MKRYYATLGGIRKEITPEQAAKIRDLQKWIANKRKSSNQQINKSTNQQINK